MLVAEEGSGEGPFVSMPETPKSTNLCVTGDNSDTVAISDHVDQQQQDLDALRELLSTGSYNFDAEALLGVSEHIAIVKKMRLGRFVCTER